MNTGEKKGAGGRGDHGQGMGGRPGPARGLIQPVGSAPELEFERVLPPRALAEIVRHYWWVRWNLRSPRVQENLPHPAVHLVFQEGEARILGVTTQRFTIELRESGWVFGVKFQPGGFSGFLDRPVSTITDKTIPASKVFGEDVEELNHKVRSLDGSASSSREAMHSRMDLVSEFLERRSFEVSDDALLSSRLVARLEEEHDLLRVEELCSSEGFSVRKVQRLFRRHVGVSPRWVISRYRLHEALDRMEARRSREGRRSERADWASFALDLGYYDQSHFIRDFVSMVGCSPEDYEKRRRTAPSG